MKFQICSVIIFVILLVFTTGTLAKKQKSSQNEVEHQNKTEKHDFDHGNRLFGVLDPELWEEIFNGTVSKK